MSVPQDRSKGPTAPPRGAASLSFRERGRPSIRSHRLRLPSAEVCEASHQMGEEFLADQADIGQLEFDSILRKLGDSYKN